MENGSGAECFFFLQFSNSWATHMLGRRRSEQDLKHGSCSNTFCFGTTLACGKWIRKSNW